MSSVLRISPPTSFASNRTAFMFARAAYSPAVSPAGPPPMMMRSKSATNSLSGSLLTVERRRIPSYSPARSSDAAYGAPPCEALPYAGMSFRLVDQPEDRPAFLRETIDILSRDLEEDRARLLERVARATDEELLAGSEDDWGIGMIAYHLLVSERGMVGIALRLARGEVPASTGQPRPEPRTTTRQV